MLAVLAMAFAVCSAAASPEPAPLRVSTYVARPVPFSETVTSTGSLRAEEGVELQPETEGKIIAIHFREGTRVRKGDLLVKLNDAELRAMLERATHRLQLAQLRERRLARLAADGMVGQDDYDTALSEVNVQKAEVALIQSRIAKTEIRAPFDGIVGLRHVSTGAFVDASTRIATLQRIDTLKLDFSVPEKYSGRIKPGQPLKFTLSGSSLPFEGKVYAVEPRIDAATRTVLIRASCANPQGNLLPGAFANVELTITHTEDALMVPAEAVVPGVDSSTVFVVRGGKAERRTIRTGVRTRNAIQVLAGLASGDVVITSGLQQLRTGMPVLADPALARQ